MTKYIKKKDLTMKALLTGASGFVGSFLAEKLLKFDYQVKALVPTKDDLRWIADLDINCVFGDLSNRELLNRVVADVDYIYHLAAVTKSSNKDDYYRINYQGTKNLLDAVNSHAKKIKRFVYVSSQAAVGPSPTLEPIAETVDPNPLSDYGKSKLKAEETVKESADNIPITILRPCSVYGPRDRDILQFFKAVRLGVIPQLGLKQKYLSLIFVKDLVTGIISAAENEEAVGQTYFLTGKRPYTWEEVSRMILKVLGKKGVRIFLPETLLKGFAYAVEGSAKLLKSNPALNLQKFREMKQEFWVCSPRKAKKELNFEAKTSLEKGVRETLNWYVEYGWL